jgi:hypothetical protein
MVLAGGEDWNNWENIFRILPTEIKSSLVSSSVDNVSSYSSLKALYDSLPPHEQAKLIAKLERLGIAINLSEGSFASFLESGSASFLSPFAFLKSGYRYAGTRGYDPILLFLILVPIVYEFDFFEGDFQDYDHFGWDYIGDGWNYSDEYDYRIDTDYVLPTYTETVDESVQQTMEPIVDFALASPANLRTYTQAVVAGSSQSQVFQANPDSLTNYLSSQLGLTQNQAQGNENLSLNPNSAASLGIQGSDYVSSQNTLPNLSIDPSLQAEYQRHAQIVLSAVDGQFQLSPDVLDVGVAAHVMGENWNDRSLTENKTYARMVLENGSSVVHSAVSSADIEQYLSETVHEAVTLAENSLVAEQQTQQVMNQMEYDA